MCVLLAISSGFAIFAVLVGIVIIIIAFSSASAKKEDTGPSSIDMDKELNWSPDVMATYMLARAMVRNRDFDNAIMAYIRMLELDPTNWVAATMLGNLTFEKNKELSFTCLKFMERHWENEGVSFDDPGLKAYALNFYMLGFHYHEHNFPDKALKFQNLAMNSRTFVKEHKEFRKRFPYEVQQAGSHQAVTGNQLPVMKEEEKLFDQAYKFAGGLYSGQNENIPSMKDKVKAIKKEYDALDQHLKYSVFKIANIHFDTVFNMTLNARASKLGDQYFIGINLGTYCILEDMFDKMLASDNVLPDYGNISLETPEKKLLNVIKTNTDLSFDPANAIHAQVKSKDPVRRQLADFYKSFAFQFIALHEYYHVVQGHIGYLRSMNLPVYAELKSSSGDTLKVDYSLEQAMERDADISATIRAFIIAKHSIKSDNPEIRSLPFYKDWESFIFHWTFAVYSSFRLFDFNQYNEVEARALPHPPPSVRMAIISMAIVGMFNGETFTKIDKNMSVIMFKATIEAEKALQSISFGPDSTNVYLNNWESEEMKEYMMGLMTKSEQVSHFFNPFSYDLSHFSFNKSFNNVKRSS